MSSVHAIFGITVVYKRPNTDRNGTAVDRNTQVLSQSGTLLCGGDMACREEPGNIVVGRPVLMDACVLPAGSWGAEEPVPQSVNLALCRRLRSCG